MNDNENFDLEKELAESIEKLVNEETIVAKAFVDSNASKHNEYNNINNSTNNKSNYDDDMNKTQVIPNIPSRNINLGSNLNNQNAENESDNDNNLTMTSTNISNPNNQDKKKLDKKTKLIIAGISGIVLLVLAIIILIATMINNKAKSSFDYNYSKGNEYYNEKNFSSALNYFEKAEVTLVGKKNIDLKFKLYDCYKAQDQDDKAVEKLKDIISLEKNNEKALTLLATYYATEKQGDKLTELIRKYQGTDGLRYLSSYVVAKPTASQNAGKYDVAVDLQLSTEGSNKIYYTLDGTDPTTKSLLYSDAIHLVKGDTTVKAIAVNAIGTSSDIVELKYTIDYKAPDAPIITPATGTYQEGQKIEITNIKNGDTAYYTLDGSTPTKVSTKYTEPFNMPVGNTIVSVIIINQYGLESSMTTKNYNVTAAKSYSFEEAKVLLITRMKSKGDLKSDTITSDGKQANFVYYTKQKINDIEMYIIYYDIDNTRQKYYFGVGVKNGQCYKVTENGGKFTLTDY